MGAAGLLPQARRHANAVALFSRWPYFVTLALIAVVSFATTSPAAIAGWGLAPESARLYPVGAPPCTTRVPPRVSALGAALPIGQLCHKV